MYDCLLIRLITVYGLLIIMRERHNCQTEIRRFVQVFSMANDASCARS